MRRLWYIFLILFCAASGVAQTDLYVDGQLLARDVCRTAQMPEALQQLLRGRELSQRQSPRRQMRVATANRIGPLLASIRGQEEPYNLLCPHWRFESGEVSTERCLSGCVATAIEQVMAYYRYPDALTDTLHGWSTENYDIADMLPGTRFDWDHYLLDYRDGWSEQQGLAIALPSLAAGMAVHMNYGLYASGANVYRAVEPLSNALGYGMVRYYERILYTPARWHAMLRHELQQGRPIVYCGHTMALSGHAFNIDGVDADGLYHLNWGYDGYYDGWYDLERLSPWEPLRVDDEGLEMGFFCNQSALFMHPSETAQPLDPDTLALDDLGIVLDAIDFRRAPDLQGYVGADFLFHNEGSEVVTYTYEVMTWQPDETDIFKNADYVGLSAITLAPGEQRAQRVYLRFAEEGERLIGISHDDITIPFQKPVSIAHGTAPRLEWGSATVAESSEEDGRYAYTFAVPVSNTAAAGYAGSDVTLCLYAEGHEGEDLRHYRVLSLAAGSATTLTVTFSDLAPATSYTFLVRCPWAVQSQLSFTTPTPTGITTLAPAPAKPASPWYDLSGRHAHGASRGLLIQKGKKIWLTN